MDAKIAINWLNNNGMVPNPKKFQLMFLARNKCIEKEMSFAGKAIKSCSRVELLDITLDKNLNLKSYTIITKSFGATNFPLKFRPKVYSPKFCL